MAGMACGWNISAEAMALPIFPSCAKAAALQELWEERGGVVFIHPQKTGGTTMCQLARREGLYTPRYWSYVNASTGGGEVQYKRIQRRISYANCGLHAYQFNNPAVCESAGIPAERCSQELGGSWETQLAFGRLFLNMEPGAQHFSESLTEHWGQEEFLLNPESDWWTRSVILFTVRDPAERFLSDLRQKNLDRACREIDLSEEDCINKMLTAEGRKFLSQEWSPATYRIVETRLLVNYLILHISGTDDDLELAKSNLRRVSLVVDIQSRPQESYFLLQEVYGRFPESDKTLDMRGLHGRRRHEAGWFEQTYPETYERVKEHLWLDFEFWQYALDSLDAHVQNLGFQPSEDIAELGPKSASQSLRRGTLELAPTILDSHA